MEDIDRHKKRTRMEMADSRTQVNKYACERHTCTYERGVGVKGGEYHGHRWENEGKKWEERNTMNDSPNQEYSYSYS